MNIRGKNTFGETKSLLFQNQRIWILAYHLVGGRTGLRIDIGLKKFRNQIGFLSQRTRVIPLCQIDRYLNKVCRDEKPIVVITFDDAYENFYKKAWPILHEFKLPSSLFIPVRFLLTKAPPPISGTDHMKPIDWRQISKMLETGLLTIGSHGFDHTDVRKLSFRQLNCQFRDSKRSIQERLGVEVNSFCYPQALWNRRTVRWSADHYNYAVVAGGKAINRNNFDPLRMPRLPITNDMPDSLEPILKSSIHLREWISDKWRRFVR